MCYFTSHFLGSFSFLLSDVVNAGKYVKKVAEVAVAQTLKKCNMTEDELKNTIDVLIFIFYCFLYMLKTDNVVLACCADDRVQD